MKRLNMQGHVRTVLSAMDGIEVVKGSARRSMAWARSVVGYRIHPQGEPREIGHVSPNFNRFSAGNGGLLQPLSKRSSASAVRSARSTSRAVITDFCARRLRLIREEGRIQQRFFQGTTSLENAVGPVPPRSGWSAAAVDHVRRVHESHHAGPHRQRHYITGSPLVNLDLNGDGKIGYVEMYRASPVAGNISVGNQSLQQRLTGRAMHGEVCSRPRRSRRSRVFPRPCSRI